MLGVPASIKSSGDAKIEPEEPGRNTKFSDKISELAVAVRKAEESLAKAQKEPIAKVEQMRNEAQSAVQRRIDALNGNMANLKAGGKIHDIKAGQKQFRADVLEDDALDAVSYAIFCVEDAHYAIPDAITARMEADEAAKR